MTAAHNGRRQVNLNVQARMSGAGIQVGWTFRYRQGKVIPGTADPELLARLWRPNPLLLLRDGFLSLGHDGSADSGFVDEGSDPAESLGGRPDQPADQQQSRQSVDDHYRQIVTASPTVSEWEIEAGSEAARARSSAWPFAAIQNRSWPWPWPKRPPNRARPACRRCCGR